MDNKESSDSNALSWRQLNVNTIPICHCGKKTKVTKSWTNENPGRRFLRCAIHGFVSWYDEERPGGWQKTALLEARDEISNLKEMVKIRKNGGNIGSFSEMGENSDNETQKQLENKAKEVIKLQNEVMLGKEREKLMRQFCVLSWGGFIAVTATIIVLLK